MEEKTFVIPPPGSGRVRSKYDFSSLKSYGESILFEGVKNPSSVRDAAYKYAKYHRIKLVTRKESRFSVRVYFAGPSSSDGR